MYNTLTRQQLCDEKWIVFFWIQINGYPMDLKSASGVWPIWLLSWSSIGKQTPQGLLTLPPDLRLLHLIQFQPNRCHMILQPWRNTLHFTVALFTLCPSAWIAIFCQSPKLPTYNLRASALSVTTTDPNVDLSLTVYVTFNLQTTAKSLNT